MFSFADEIIKHYSTSASRDKPSDVEMMESSDTSAPQLGHAFSQVRIFPSPVSEVAKAADFVEELDEGLEAAQKATEEGLGVELRGEIKNVAVGWVGSPDPEPIVDPDVIAQQKKSYTTCNDFAFGVYKKAVEALRKKKPGALPEIENNLYELKILINDEIDAQGKVDDVIRRTKKMYSLEMYNKSEGEELPSLDQLNQQLIELTQELKDLVEKKQPTGEVRKKKALVLALSKHLKANNYESKKTKLLEVAEETESKGFVKPDKPPAPIKPDDLTENSKVFGNRPNAGDFLIMLQPRTEIYRGKTLHAGSFRHINVFREKSSEEVIDEKEGPIEKWHTIDGGGLYPKERTYYIRLRDHMVFLNGPPWEKAEPHYKFFGWIDSTKLPTWQKKPQQAKKQEAETPK